jgi:CHASE3 domain sensor protein
MPLRFKIAGSIVFALLFMATVGSIVEARANKSRVEWINANAQRQEK